jgi:hypothetical protein
MKLDRIPYDPGTLISLYEEGLASLGALCERTWHDRLQVVAEGSASRLWRTDGALHEIELRFAPAEAAAARDASREVFPGCPLTFRLAETLRRSPLALDRFALPDAAARPPDPSVMEKLWRGQFSDTTRWQLASPPSAEYHFTLLALARCEIQAIDQHWSLHRVAISLADGEPDTGLARDIAFQQSATLPAPEIAWPQPQPQEWRQFLSKALELDLSDEIARVRSRQESSLRRELNRVDEYFDAYERELTDRAKRTSNQNSKIKLAHRLAAAKIEHERRRADQLARHEIRILPHLDALLLVAEKAWRAQVHVGRHHHTQTTRALFVPRLRQWKLI